MDGGKELLPYRMRCRKWKENVAGNHCTRDQQRRGETKINSFFRLLAGIFLLAPLLPPPSQIRTERKRGGAAQKKCLSPLHFSLNWTHSPLSSFLPCCQVPRQLFISSSLFPSLSSSNSGDEDAGAPLLRLPTFPPFCRFFLPSFPEEC